MADVSGMMNELQRAEYDQLLIDDLRELLDEGVDADNSRWVHAVLDELCASLEYEFARERERGYLSEFLQRYPRQTQQVSDLEAEHAGLCKELIEFRDRLDSSAGRQRVRRETRKLFCDWVRRLSSMKRMENRLLQDAMTSVEGEFE